MPHVTSDMSFWKIDLGAAVPEGRDADFVAGSLCEVKGVRNISIDELDRAVAHATLDRSMNAAEIEAACNAVADLANALT